MLEAECLSKISFSHVDCDDEVVLALSLDIIESLIANIHENGWQVGHHEDTKGNYSFKFHNKICSKQAHTA